MGFGKKFVVFNTGALITSYLGYRFYTRNVIPVPICVGGLLEKNSPGTYWMDSYTIGIPHSELSPGQLMNAFQKNYVFNHLQKQILVSYLGCEQPSKSKGELGEDLLIWKVVDRAAHSICMKLQINSPIIDGYTVLTCRDNMLIFGGSIPHQIMDFTLIHNFHKAYSKVLAASIANYVKLHECEAEPSNISNTN